MNRIGKIEGRYERTDPAETGGSGGLSHWWLLALLTLLHLLNHLDRRALPAVFPLLQAEWALTDGQLGLVATGYTLARALVTLPAGWMADRRGRVPVLRLAGILWGVAATLSGLAGTFAHFLLARTVAGSGDGANGPVDVAYLSDHFPARRRARVLSLYTLGMYAGGALGFAAGAYVGERLGWRWSFLLPGVAGLAGALLLGKLPEAQRPPPLSVPVAPLTGNEQSWRSLLSGPLLLAVAGGIMGSFATTALAAWTPTFIHRSYGLDVTEAGVLAAALFLPASMAGALLGGFLSDHLLARFAGARPLTAGLTLLLGVPAGVAALVAPSLPVYAAATFLGTLFLSSHLVPLTVLVQEVAPPHRRALAMALLLLLTQALGGAPAVAAVGFFSDLVGLRQALFLPLGGTLLGGILLLAGSRRLTPL